MYEGKEEKLEFLLFAMSEGKKERNDVQAGGRAGGRLVAPSDDTGVLA